MYHKWRDYKKYFKLDKGTRHGDPIPVYLFIFVKRLYDTTKYCWKIIPAFLIKKIRKKNYLSLKLNH